MDMLKQYLFSQISEKKLSPDLAKQLLTELNNYSKANSKNTDVAIIGMAGRFPKARDLSEFWDNLLEQKNCIDVPSQQRRSPYLELYKKILGVNQLDDNHFEVGGYLNDIDLFDAEFFGIHDSEASYMDPWQRQPLEVAYLALEDAGYGGEAIARTNTSVIIGRDMACESSYSRTAAEPSPLLLTGTYESILASRIAHTLDLSGPCMMIDTACSSSLVALNQACLLIQSGKSSMAIVGGINLKDNIVKMKHNPMNNILTQDQVVRTFDKQASGTLLGEGIGVLILKSYEEAVKDKDMIWAVIKGAEINNDGKVNRISSPNSQAQEKVIIQTYENAGISMEDIGYVEAHGTGTLLGDPIEVSAIDAAFKHFTPRKQFCALGTVKTNIGHTVGASGMASIMKAVLSLHHKRIPANINFNEVNPYISFERTALYVNDRTTDWEIEDGKSRICGINSFGFSGTNCHVILQELPVHRKAKEKRPARDPKLPYIFTASAKSVTSLEQLLIAYQDVLSNQHIEIEDLCYSSCSTRSHYNYRIAILATDISQLEQDVRRILEKGMLSADKQIIDDCIYINVESQLSVSSPNYISADKYIENMGNDELQDIAKRYIQGANVDWNTIYDPEKHQKIRLPLYPLNRRSYWMDQSEISVENFIGIEKLEAQNTEDEDSLVDLAMYRNMDTESLLTAIWTNVLKCPEIHKNENFYLIGGDSLRAMKIIDMLKQIIDCKVDVTDLLQNPTLEEFLTVVNAKINHGSEERTNIQKIPVNPYGNYLASSVQKRMFFLSRYNKDDTSYNLSSAIRITGKFDTKKCNDVMNQLIHRHEALRTSFFTRDEILYYHVDERLDFQIQEVECGDDPQALLDDFIMPFDLGKAPLMRAAVASIKDNEFMLLLDFHHIIADATSLEIFTNEFIQLYHDMPVVDLPLQYKDFNSWQMNYYQSDEIKEQQAFWLEQLKGELPVLDLPTERTRPPIQDFTGSALIVHASESLTQKVTKLAGNLKMSEFMVLISAYNIMLHRYTDQEDIIIGSPVQGRKRAEFKNMMGMFVNTILLRNYPAASKNIEEFLQEVKENCLLAYKNQDYPFEEIVNQLDVVRDYSRNPIFDTMFNFLNYSHRKIELQDMEIGFVDFDSNVSKFDITLEAVKQEKILSFKFEYSTHLFSDEFMRNMANNYLHILDEIVSDTNRSIGELEIISPDEKKMIVHDFNTSSQYNLPDESLIDWFEKNVSQIPENKAVVDSNVSYTFRQLGDMVNKLCTILEENDIQHGHVVGVYMERSVYSVAAMLAILKHNAVYLPLDSNLPLERLKMIAEDSKMAFILTQSHYWDSATVLQLPCYSVDGDHLQRKQGGSAEPGQLSEISYIIYTSGSEQKPKGVAGLEKGLINRLNWMWDEYPFAQDEVCCHKTPINFVDSICEILSPVLYGIPLVIVPDRVLNSPNEFITFLSKHEVTRITLIPSLLSLILQSNLKLNVMLAKLRLWISSGEALSVELVDKFRSRMKGHQLINLYGSSEVSADVTCFDTADLDSDASRVPIGKPIDNTRIYVLNDKQRIVPIGVWGTLYIAGDGVAKGYLYNEELTNKKFIKLDISGRGVKTLFNTGDRVRFNKCGYLEYLGRNDHQVKINGCRVELDEVESSIRDIVGDTEVCVCSYTNSTNHQQLLAFIKGDADDYSTPLIRNRLMQKLPRYMIPTDFVVCKQFLHLLNGKIDRSKMVEQFLVRQQNTSANAADLTEIEEIVISIWREVLNNNNEITPDSSIFDLGGNSLQAMQFNMAVNQKFFVDIALKDLFKGMSIRDMAGFIEGEILKKNDEDELESLLKEIDDLDNESIEKLLNS
ncbi:non-ribosomal peptide synthetase [Paenibacillus sp.]|jgi:amino acid adenylation domain-containing protein|uniref:non-ribosomal peptide synthetase n=1 Tax=Paenibacillus sp. TaxID=58172 RepID=UPI00282D3EBE|nr:non-ribosomal peptide synthetase [Paenibacillus sp.]MDR0268842.1 amino acid adenylation domain-containing protein [Paenibacillus sp.]